MTRTDVHSPTNMDPTQYEFVLCFDNDDTSGIVPDPETVAVMAELAESPSGRGCWQCHHCGARIRYGAALRHLPTGELIAVGQTCLDGRFSLASKAEFDRLRKAAELARADQRIVKACNAWLAEQAPVFSVLLDKHYDFAATEMSGWAIGVARDIRRKFRTYGDLSEKQAAFLLSLVNEAGERAEARRAEEAAKAAKLNEWVGSVKERLTLTLTVLWVRQLDSEWGTTWLIGMEDAEGRSFKWFGSGGCASSLEPGDVVTGKGTVKEHDEYEGRKTTVLTRCAFEVREVAA